MIAREGWVEETPGNGGDQFGQWFLSRLTEESSVFEASSCLRITCPTAISKANHSLVGDLKRVEGDLQAVVDCRGEAGLKMVSDVWLACAGTCCG